MAAGHLVAAVATVKVPVRDQEASLLNDSMTASTSQTILRAGVWHLPADRAAIPPTCFHSKGEIVKPTIMSSIARACWEFTLFISMVLGLAKASKTAFFVISRNAARGFVRGFSFSRRAIL
jgi:hypothetical protein